MIGDKLVETLVDREIDALADAGLLPEHSDLGASSAERWMNCAGSVELIRQLNDTRTIEGTTDEPEYRTHGTAAHHVAAHCLENNLEAWEMIGETFTSEGKPITVDQEMADAVQVFLTTCRAVVLRDPIVYIEHKMHHPDFHPSFFGTVDHGVVGFGPYRDLQGMAHNGVVLDVNDFKYGVGIVVDVEWNPQLMYYAYGILRKHPEVEWVRLRIVQPRVTWREAVQTWEVDAETIRNWAEGELRPAMIRTDSDIGLTPGEHCRFCPAKLVCPVLKGLFGAAASADPKTVVDFSDEELDREYPLIDSVKMYIRAVEAEAFNRLAAGSDAFSTIKLVKKKANRVWKSEAEVLFKARYGAEAFGEPMFKSPAEMEKLGAGAKDLVHEYAYTPESGLTVAGMSDKRAAVKVQPSTEVFSGAAKEHGNA